MSVAKVKVKPKRKPVKKLVTIELCDLMLNTLEAVVIADGEQVSQLLDGKYYEEASEWCVNLKRMLDGLVASGRGKR